MISIKAPLSSENSILEATDRQMGLEMFRQYKPGVIDIMFPRLAGMAILKKVKADKNLFELPAITITAKAMKGDKEKILEAGFDDYIAKPFKNDILVEKTKTLLKNKLMLISLMVPKGKLYNA